ARAAELFRASLRIYALRGPKHAVAHCLIELADLAARQGDDTGAARWLGALQAVDDQPVRLLPPVRRADYSRLLDTLRHKLGETAFEATLAGGRTTPLERLLGSATAAPSAN